MLQITILDLSSVGPASRCTAILADLGATVIKVLPLSKDKRIEPEFWTYGAGRGTRRVRIDLRSGGGRDLFLRLAAIADVVVESYRPGVASRLGIGYEDVRKHNERIVYCALTGYGADGPYAQRAGHDLNYLAIGGYLATQGRGADGVPAMPGATVADSAGGGMQAAIAILAAVVERGSTGTGRFLDVATTEGVLSLTSLFLDDYLATGRETTAGSSLLTGGFACYGLYAARDGGWLAVAAIEPRFFANLCAALGCGSLAPHQMDPARQDEIRAAFRDAFSSRDRDEWAALLGDADCCVTPVLSIAEVAADAHLNARGAFGTAEHPTHGSFRQVAALGRPGEAAAAHGDGTDTDAVLRETGLTPEEIAALSAAGVVE